MAVRKSKKYIVISTVLHLGVLAALVLGVDMTAPLMVVENTNKQDVISAVVLGDSAKSKILPHQAPAAQPTPKPEPKPEPPKPAPAPAPKPEPKPVVQEKPVEKTIALKPPEKKLKPSDIFAKDLLEDISKVKKKVAKQKKEKQKKMQADFQKTLREQSELTMRKNLMNEDIHLKSMQSRDAQGIINKYQALIQQAISEHWVIPPQTNKKLSSVLMIRLAPGGMVLDVQITKSSGDPALDSSARAAVLKASPLPVPKERTEFEPFRQFSLKVKPENIQDDGLTG